MTKVEKWSNTQYAVVVKGTVVAVVTTKAAAYSLLREYTKRG